MSAISSITQPVIVQIVPRLEQGGVERGTIEMAESIQARGWKAVVISNGGGWKSQLNVLALSAMRCLSIQKIRSNGLLSAG